MSFSIFLPSHLKIEQSLLKRIGEGKLSHRIIFRTYSYEHPNRTAVIFWDNPDFAMPSINFSEKNPRLSMLALAPTACFAMTLIACQLIVVN
jgi:hypothetical protein